MHSTEPEFKSKCISNISSHKYMTDTCLPMKRAIFYFPKYPPPRLFQPPDYCYIEPFPAPPPQLFSRPPFIRYSRALESKVETRVFLALRQLFYSRDVMIVSSFLALSLFFLPSLSRLLCTIKYYFARHLASLKSLFFNSPPLAFLKVPP